MYGTKSDALVTFEAKTMHVFLDGQMGKSCCQLKRARITVPEAFRGGFSPISHNYRPAHGAHI